MVICDDIHYFLIPAYSRMDLKTYDLEFHQIRLCNLRSRDVRHLFANLQVLVFAYCLSRDKLLRFMALKIELINGFRLEFFYFYTFVSRKQKIFSLSLVRHTSSYNVPSNLFTHINIPNRITLMANKPIISISGKNPFLLQINDMANDLVNEPLTSEPHHIFQFSISVVT